MGAYWLTTLTSIRRGEPDWRAIAAYEAPVRRHLARRFPGLPAAEREDLAQEVLVAMRERIVPGYDAAAGSFRAFLCQAIANKVRDHFRRRRPAAALEDDDLPPEARDAAPDPEEAQALDLEGRIVRAVQRVHDRHSQGPDADLELVWVLSGVLVHGLSNKEIARREGLSADQVKRKLQRARAEVLGGVLGELLPPGAPAPDVERAADLVRACLRQPRRAARLLEAEPAPAVREAAGALLDGLRHAQGLLAGGGAGDDGVDLVRGIQAIFAA